MEIHVAVHMFGFIYIYALLLAHRFSLWVDTVVQRFESLNSGVAYVLG